MFKDGYSTVGKVLGEKAGLQQLDNTAAHFRHVHVLMLTDLWFDSLIRNIFIFFLFLHFSKVEYHLFVGLDSNDAFFA